MCCFFCGRRRRLRNHKRIGRIIHISCVVAVVVVVVWFLLGTILFCCWVFTPGKMKRKVFGGGEAKNDPFYSHWSPRAHNVCGLVVEGTWNRGEGRVGGNAVSRVWFWGRGTDTCVCRRGIMWWMMQGREKVKFSIFDVLFRSLHILKKWYLKPSKYLVIKDHFTNIVERNV